MIMSQPLKPDSSSSYDYELSCSFCMASKNSTINDDTAHVIPSCRQCIGLIYAIKRKQYFSVN